MKHLKVLGVVAVSAIGLMAFNAGSVSATTLEVGGGAQLKAVTTTASLNSGTSLTLKTTGGLFVNTCSGSHLQGQTAAPFTAIRVGGPLSELRFDNCELRMTVVNAGSLDFEHIPFTTNATVRWVGAQVKIETSLGNFDCKTGEGADFGTLTGVTEGHATLHLNAVINCAGLSSSMVWKGTYTVTSPTGLGVSA